MAIEADDIAEALGCFWNAAIGEAHAQQEGAAFASIMAVGIAAVAERFRELGVAATTPPPAEGAVAKLREAMAAWALAKRSEAVKCGTHLYLAVQQAADEIERLQASEVDLATRALALDEALTNKVHLLQDAIARAEAAEKERDEHAKTIAAIQGRHDGLALVVAQLERRAEAAGAREAKLLEALAFYADPAHWWTRDSDNPFKMHQSGDGSMEQLEARCGTYSHPKGFVHPQFCPDGGRVARRALATTKDG